MHDPSVCTPVPGSGGFTASFTGELRGEMDGTYATELLKRVQDPDDPSSYFVKYSRFERTPMITSNHASLGHIEMRMVQPGTCLTSAVITAMYYAGGTSMIPGVSAGDAVSVFGMKPPLCHCFLYALRLMSSITQSSFFLFGGQRVP